MQRRFQIIDVFSEAPFRGNPLAVVHDAEGITGDEMLQFTRWMNLSETTFLLPPTEPGADYRVRIFSPPGELPFAGHPTIGTCHAWASAGGVPRVPGTIVQECGAGLVTVRPIPAGYAFAAPALRRSGPADAETRERVARVLRIQPAEIVHAEWVDNGPGWVVAMLADADAVLRVNPQLDDPGLPAVGVAGPHAAGAAWAFEVRGFFINGTGATVEDPVTGSLNASLAQWLFTSGRASSPYVARQGTALGREGRVHLERDAAGTTWVGGSAVTFVEGSVDL
jgi:PhzF family phenazine biosynthesis protein